MYSWDKSRKHQIMNPPLSSSSSTLPSFSSTLLDEIYHSIDAGGPKRDGPKLPRDRIFETRDQRNAGVKDEEINNRRRANRVEKWIQNKDHHDKISTRRRQSLPDYDRAFFTSSWSSSDSSSGGETESTPAMYKPRRSSCFTGEPNPTPARTTSTTMEKTPKSSKHASNKSYPFDSRNHDHEDMSEAEAKSKLRALKMYNNLKKAKQPISPGIRLTSFLNSLFSHGNSKKSTKQSNDDVYVQSKPRQTSSSSISTCSSSCLITHKITSPVIVNPKEKKPIKLNNGSKRRVRFDPVSVIVDDQEDDDDEDDGSVSSDISSDLFELDHLAFMGSSYKARDYNQELPVYETTRPVQVGSNSRHGRRIIY